jgi:hypothetical protein
MCTEAYGSSHQKPFLRMMEKVLLGDARRRGETHQWLYDKVNLSILLIRLGYKDPRISRYDESQIPNWRRFGLEENDLGDEYKPGSLYIEAQK